MAELPQIVDLRQSPTALRVQRGVMRFLRAAHDFCCYAEVPLRNGRRADVVAVGPKGEIWIVEIKSSLEDFRVDLKWPEYRDYCDRLFFAVALDFPQEVLPGDTGLIVADRYGGELLREAPEHNLPAARRKAVLIRFARAAASRLMTIADPERAFES